jgi:hypothetical protein
MYKKVSCYCRVTVIRSGIFIFISNSGACLVVVDRLLTVAGVLGDDAHCSPVWLL